MVVRERFGRLRCRYVRAGPFGLRATGRAANGDGFRSCRSTCGLIWNQLLDRLIQADLEIDLADPERGIIVARYSGDPEPYVTCGWILVDRGGELEEIPASGATSFKRVVQGRRLEVNRDLNLDARLVVEVNPDGDGAAVETTSNYVLTKTVAAANQAGWTRGRAQEVVSFSSGGRGEFSKGTICQSNGALERTVLDVLPPATRALSAGAEQLGNGRISGGQRASCADRGGREPRAGREPQPSRAVRRHRTAKRRRARAGTEPADCGERRSGRGGAGDGERPPGPAPQAAQAGPGAPEATGAHAEQRTPQGSRFLSRPQHSSVRSTTGPSARCWL